MKTILENWFKDSHTKVTSPLVGAYISSFILFNWKYFYVLFWGTGTVENRLSFFNQFVGFTNIESWLYPLLAALVYVFLLPFINYGTTRLLEYPDTIRLDAATKSEMNKIRENKKVQKHRYLADPDKPFLQREIEAELKEQEERAEKEKLQREAIQAEAQLAKEKLVEQEAITKQAEMEQEKTRISLEKDQSKFRLAKAREEEELKELAAPLLFNLTIRLSESLADEEIILPLHVLVDIYVKLFGYDNAQQLLEDREFRYSNLSNLFFLLYDPKELTEALRLTFETHKIEIDTQLIFDHLSETLAYLPKPIHLIADDEVEDSFKNFVDDYNNIHAAFNLDSVTSAMAETNAYFDDIQIKDLVQVIHHKEPRSITATFEATISGTTHEDKAFYGDSINATFDLVSDPLLGRNGFRKPIMYGSEASVDQDF
jgi:hypothetical protein